ncbi:MAG: RlmE family RNA methyltransferase [Bacteroidia bacterium]|nr:RlmE family RNA methyltransferase [Bacteroidia bacterium]MDW8134580.1 RlmE family RNA methyltransferase [Bacteroidia bacterium]
MRYEPKDIYFRRAKAEGYVARSVYKLKEIDARYRLLKPGDCVIDLGAAPGSWSQYVVEKCGKGAEVCAIDLQPLGWYSPQVHFYQLDVFSSEVEAILSQKRWRGVLSDMAPLTTGSRPTDQARSAALVERSLVLAESFLLPGGFWVAKLLEGPELPRLLNKAKKVFRETFIFRPQSTRKGSTECFLIGKDRYS